MNDPDMRTWAEISLKNIEHNYFEIRKNFPPVCRFAGVIKADAYGHGAVPVGKILEKLGAEYLAVSCLAEAMELRKAGLKTQILIFGISPPEIARLPKELNLIQTVGDIETARQMSKILTETGMRQKIHIKLDTGMGRIGFVTESEKTEYELKELMSLPGFDAEGIYTHFAISDERGNDFTQAQFKRFMSTAENLEKSTGHRFALKHCANSGAVINCREYAEDMIRPGISLYGMYPGPDKGGLDLRPAMQLKTRIVSIAAHKAGDTVSYGRAYTASKTERTAVIPVGYADGLHRVLSGKTDVLVRGKRAPQIGRICMDMCMIDVTDIPECRPGDIVTVFGYDGDERISAEEQAEKAGTICYETVCAVSKRVRRIYT